MGGMGIPPIYYLWVIMDAQTKHLLIQSYIEERCEDHGEPYPPGCYWCDGNDPEEEEWHVWAFYEALGEGDYERAEEHRDRIILSC